MYSTSRSMGTRPFLPHVKRPSGIFMKVFQSHAIKRGYSRAMQLSDKDDEEDEEDRDDDNTDTPRMMRMSQKKDTPRRRTSLTQTIILYDSPNNVTVLT